MTTTPRCVRVALALACALLAACWDRQSGERFGQLVLVMIYGVVFTFAAMIVVPIFYMIGRSIWLRREHDVLLAGWFDAAKLGRIDLTPGAPERISFRSEPGMRCSVWVHLASLGPPGTFRLAITVRAGPETPVSQVFEARLDSDAGLVGVPFHEGIAGFEAPGKVYVRRLCGFAMHFAGPATADVSFEATGGTLAGHGELFLLAGEPPDGPERARRGTSPAGAPPRASAPGARRHRVKS